MQPHGYICRGILKMRKILSVMAVSLGLASVAMPAKADIAVGAGVGTLGYGVHVATSLTDFVAIRFNGNFGEMDVPGAELIGSSFAGIDYDIDAKFSSYGLIADFHPLALSPIGAGFVLSGGVYYNKNEFDFTADLLTGVDIGGTPLTEDVRMIGNMSFGTEWAPYIGFGYDGTFQGIVPVSFFFTGGVLFQGSPDMSLTTNSTTINTTFATELETEAQQIEDDASTLEYYPVVSMGVTISF
jgi:hypothetical protein